MSIRNISSGAAIILTLALVLSCSRPTADKAFASGLAYAEKGSWQQAINSYTDALKGKPDWIDAYVNRGVARAALGDNAGAIADYDAALRLDPKDTAALMNRGVARHELGQYKEALADYSAALEADE